MFCENSWWDSFLLERAKINPSPAALQHKQDKTAAERWETSVNMRQHQASEAPSMFCLVFPLMFTSDVRRGGDRDNNRGETLRMAVSMLKRTAVFQREDAVQHTRTVILGHMQFTWPQKKSLKGPISCEIHHAIVFKLYHINGILYFFECFTSQKVCAKTLEITPLWHRKGHQYLTWSVWTSSETVSRLLYFFFSSKFFQNISFSS